MWDYNLVYSFAKGCGQSSNLQASGGTQILLWPRERAGTQKQHVYSIMTLTCPPSVLSPQFGLRASKTFHGGENQSEGLFAPHVLYDQKAICAPAAGNSSRGARGFHPDLQAGIMQPTTVRSVCLRLTRGCWLFCGLQPVAAAEATTVPKIHTQGFQEKRRHRINIHFPKPRSRRWGSPWSIWAKSH